MLPTPDLSHLTKRDYEYIYEPAEDTFLLMDALEQEREFLTTTLKPSLCLEIGSGSGCVISFFSKLMAPLAVACVASDLNRKACDATRLTGLQNGCSIDVLNTSLAGGIRRPANASSSSGASGGEHYHCGLFDVILYNPPYVPTEHEEIYHHTHDEEGLLRAAWAGGIDGRYWIDQVIPLMPQLLSAQGVLYMILLDANRPDDLRREALERYGLSSEIVLRRRAGIEYLMVVKMWRS